jgi:methylamine dehydrogenase accessory protein MauD
MSTAPVWEVLVLVLVCVAAVQAFALVAVMRQVGGLLVRLNPTGVGEVESGPDVDRIVELPGIPPGRPALVVFASPGCTLCRFFETALPAIRANYNEIDVVAVVMGAEDALERSAYARRLGEAGRADIPELAKDWNVQGTPFAVGLDDEHRVRVRGVANTLDHLESVAEAIILPRVEPEDPEDGGVARDGVALAAGNGHISEGQPTAQLRSPAN